MSLPMMFRVALMSVGAILLAACGQQIPVKATYYFPQAMTQFVISETITCSADSKQLGVGYSVTANTTYVRDLQNPGMVDLNLFYGVAKDPDITFTFTPDGRLSTINANSSGEGSTIVKDVAAFGSSIAEVAKEEDGKVFGIEATKPPAYKPSVVCPLMSKLAPKKPVAAAVLPAKPGVPAPATSMPSSAVLTYSANVSFSADAEGIPGEYRVKPRADDKNNNKNATTVESKDKKTAFVLVQVDPSSEAIAKSIGLESQAGIVIIALSTSSLVASLEPPAQWCKKIDPPTGKGAICSEETFKEPAEDVPRNFYPLKLNRVVEAPVQVVAFNGDTNAYETVWRASIDVPAHGYYHLLVPTGTNFGTHKFALELAGSGSITKIQYAGTGATDPVLQSANAVASALPTAASKESADKTAADAIYQSQRKANCMKDPANCKPN